MKQLTLIFCIAFFSVASAQSQVILPTAFHLPVLSTSHFTFVSKSLYLNAPSGVSLKKEFSLKYQPAPLPFFCGMEEKCRNKFNVFLKIRAGNDESYEKMIKPSGK